MAIPANIHAPDKWYALSETGKVIKEAFDKANVKTDAATFYVVQKYSHTHKLQVFYKYFVLNLQFKRTIVSQNGISCDRHWFKEGMLRSSETGKNINFYLFDKSNTNCFFRGGSGIEAIERCFSFMEELGNYASWKEWKLNLKVEQQAMEIESLQNTNSDLQNENKQLKERLSLIEENKTDFQKLYHILFQEGTSKNFSV